MNPLKPYLITILCVLLLAGCTRDDICPEDTPTTPLLIITFKDFSNRTLAKNVPNLQVRDAEDSSIILFSTTTTDSIAIPLRNFANRTELIFTRDANSDDLGGPNEDQFNLVYTTEDIYINRACGFKSNYNEVAGQLINESGGNWIFSFEVLTTTISDQDEAHLTLFH